SACTPPGGMVSVLAADPVAVTVQMARVARLSSVHRGRSRVPSCRAVLERAGRAISRATRTAARAAVGAVPSGRIALGLRLRSPLSLLRRPLLGLGALSLAFCLESLDLDACPLGLLCRSALSLDTLSLDTGSLRLLRVEPVLLGAARGLELGNPRGNALVR